jgi:hypothetical protein
MLMNIIDFANFTKMYDFSYEDLFKISGFLSMFEEFEPYNVILKRDNTLKSVEITSDGIECKTLDDDIIVIQYNKSIKFNKDIILYSFFVKNNIIYLKINKNSISSD